MHPGSDRVNVPQAELWNKTVQFYVKHRQEDLTWVIYCTSVDRSRRWRCEGLSGADWPCSHWPQAKAQISTLRHFYNPFLSQSHLSLRTAWNNGEKNKQAVIAVMYVCSICTYNKLVLMAMMLRYQVESIIPSQVLKCGKYFLKPF